MKPYYLKQHIKGIVEEYSKMAGFVRATRNGQFTESTQKLIAEGINHYQSLRESLGKLAGHRGYNAYFESWSPPLMEDESEENNLNELFVQETLDPRIESVMPILNKLHKKVAEMKEVNELSEWADSLTEAPGAETLAHKLATFKPSEEYIGTVGKKFVEVIEQGMDEATEQPAEPFKTGYPRVKNPQILGTQNRAKSAYHPPTRPPIKKLDKPLPENLGNELKSKSLEAITSSLASSSKKFLKSSVSYFAIPTFLETISPVFEITNVVGIEGLLKTSGKALAAP